MVANPSQQTGVTSKNYQQAPLSLQYETNLCAFRKNQAAGFYSQQASQQQLQSQNFNQGNQSQLLPHIQGQNWQNSLYQHQKNHDNLDLMGCLG